MSHMTSYNSRQIHECAVPILTCLIQPTMIFTMQHCAISSGSTARFLCFNYTVNSLIVYHKVTNKEILERTGLPSMEDLLIRKNLRWTGHLMRMSSDRLPKQVLYSQLSSGHRKRGRPRLRFKDTIKRNLKLRDIKIDSWTSLSQQRDKWRARVK